MELCLNTQLGGKPLTERELQVLRGAASGEGNSDTGRRLNLATETVKHHRRRILAKLGAQNTAHAIHLAHQQGLL